MAESIKLSIIVPVYNVEKYIEKNVRSVIDNISDTIEVLYVDDGSVDSSCDIIERNIENLSNVKLYKKANSGPGATRNYGLDRARGEYVFYLDSDDYLTDGLLSKLIAEASNNNLDALEFCYRLVDEKGTELVGPNKSSEEMVNKVMSGAEWLRTEKCCSLQVAYLYRRDYLLENGLRMPEGVIHEDVEFVAKCMWYAKRFMKINECLYNYVMRATSIMHTKGKQHRTDSYAGIYRTIEFAENEVDEATYNAYFEPYIISKFYNYIHIQIQNDENIRKNMESNPKFRGDLLSWLKRSHSLSKRFQYISVKYKLYELYTFMYKIYNKIRPNYLMPK